MKKTAEVLEQDDQVERTADGSSRKILRALLAFTADCPRHSAESLSEEIGVPLSSTYRYIAILRKTDLIDEDGRGSYILTSRVIGLAQAARAGTDLSAVARPYMRRLSQEIGETVIMLRRSGDRAVCIERSESTSRMRITFDVGTALPLHRGAGPKLLLAHLPLSETDAIIDDVVLRDPAFAAYRRPLMNELAAIREQGWSESRAEITPHIYAVSVPIRGAGGVVAVLSLVAPAFRIPKTSELRTRQLLQKAAFDIGKAYCAVSF